MNIDSLTTKEFSDVIWRVERAYNYQIPRDVKAALFIRVVSDPQNDAFRLQKRIDKGTESLKKKLASKDRDLYGKLFKNPLDTDEAELKALIDQESIEISVAIHICEERLSFAKDVWLNHIARDSLLSLRELIDELLCNCR